VPVIHIRFSLHKKEPAANGRRFHLAMLPI
jgi:hypothetical protein